MKYQVDKYPKITVILPVLNGAKTLEKALRSVVDQNYPDLELMVLDGGSTDGTLEVINKYKSNVTFFRSRKDEGNAEAQNEARDLCKGDIISLLCADDYYEPNTFFKVAETFIENPDAEMVNVLGRTLSMDEKGYIRIEHVTRAEDMHLAKGHVKVLHPNCRFFKKELFNKYGKIIGAVEGEMALASDWEYLTRFSLYNPKNITLDFVGYNYLAHEGSLTLNTNKYTKLRIYDQKVYYLEQLLANYQHLLSEGMKAGMRAEYRVALARRITKNLIDGNFNKAKKNLMIGIDKFGMLYIFNIFRFFISYVFRFNKLSRMVRGKLKYLIDNYLKKDYKSFELSMNSIADNIYFRESKPGKELLNKPLGFIDIGARGGAHDIVEPVARITSVLGFEPDVEECKRLMSLPDVVKPWAKIDFKMIALSDKDGDAELKLINEPSNSSLLSPNKLFVKRYNMNKWLEVGSYKLKTTTLDKAISEINEPDVRYGEFIKLDTQGTEFEILKGSIETMSKNTVAIITEVSFCELYKGQKLFSDIEMLLRQQGFSFYGFISLHSRSKKLLDKITHITREREIFSNAVFFKDPLSSKGLILDERSIYSLFTVSLLTGYYDFAYELALETWLKDSDEEEGSRIKNLINEISYMPPQKTKLEIEKINKRARKTPELANIIAGNFVDRRRSFCDYDDVLNISSLPKTK